MIERRRDRLVAQGFDLCSIRDDWPPTIKVGCSQCEAVVINGVACHEHGCPNAAKVKRAVHQDEEECDG